MTISAVSGYGTHNCANDHHSEMAAFELLRAILATPDVGHALLQRIRNALTGKWNFEVVPDKNRIHFVVQDSGISHDVVILVDERAEVVTLILSYRRKTPASVRMQMAMLLGQLTLATHVGGFEMDPSDGECRFRHSVDVESLDPPNSFFQRMVAIHIKTGCKVWSMLEQVMNGGEQNIGLRIVL